MSPFAKENVFIHAWHLYVCAKVQKQFCTHAHMQVRPKSLPTNSLKIANLQSSQILLNCIQDLEIVINHPKFWEMDQTVKFPLTFILGTKWLIVILPWRIYLKSLVPYVIMLAQ